MKAVTEGQRTEMDDTVKRFVEDRAFDGMTAVVIVFGREYDVIAYAKGDAEMAGALCERASKHIFKKLDEQKSVN